MLQVSIRSNCQVNPCLHGKFGILRGRITSELFVLQYIQITLSLRTMKSAYRQLSGLTPRVHLVILKISRNVLLFMYIALFTVS